MLEFVGFDVLAPRIVYGPAHLSDDERKAHLAAFANRLKKIESEAVVEIGVY
jgi:putative NADPH-quinone reductase